MIGRSSAHSHFCVSCIATYHAHRTCAQTHRAFAYHRGSCTALKKVRCTRCDQGHGMQLSVRYTRVVHYIRVCCIQQILCGTGRILQWEFHTLSHSQNSITTVKARNNTLGGNVSKHPKTWHYFGPGCYLGPGRYLGPMDEFFSRVSAQYVLHQKHVLMHARHARCTVM